MDLSSAPVAISELGIGLEQKGLSRVTVRADNAANQLVEYAHPSGLVIRLLADRGQWFVDVGRREWDQWFDVDTWKACLAGVEIPLDPGPLDQQVKWLEERWESLLALGPGAPLNSLLLERRERALARLGFPPGGPPSD